MAENKKTLRQKLLDVQMEIGAIKKDATNPFFNSKYFDINSLLAQVKPILNKHGLVLVQGLTTIQGSWIPGVGASPMDAKLGIETQILDTDSDEKVSFACPLPEVPDAQKAGSAITYFRRYGLQSLLALEAEDDDAEGAMGRKTKATRTTKSPINNDEPPF